jgi:hypothetical protein
MKINKLMHFINFLLNLPIPKLNKLTIGINIGIANLKKYI